MITAWLVSIGVLVFQRDLGSSILFFGLFLVMIYVATSRISWVIIGVLLMAGGSFVAAKVFSHVALRIDGWINAFTPEVYGREFGGSFRSWRVSSAWPTAALWARDWARAGRTWFPSPTAT
ncbi:uncharacterized FtsW-like protein [Arthrobacter sp. Hiyo6]|nr:uncharacterized FtsW-like protein [Arthrobacter sp. Hiyo6]